MNPLHATRMIERPMQALNTALKLWLRQQSQLIAPCTSSVAVRIDDHHGAQILAKWPDTTEADNDFSQAITEVFAKQRVHLQPVGDTKMIMALPVVLRDQVWGAVIFCLEIKDKSSVPPRLKILQQGVGWLLFIIDQDEKNKTATAIGLAPVARAHDHYDTHSAQLLHLVGRLLKENSLQETAISIVNFLATQLKSHRISLGLQTPNGIDLSAVSFSANFDKRTSAMMAIVDAMQEAIDQRINIDVSADNKETDGALIVRHHLSLLTSQTIQRLKTILLRKDTQIIGAITIELNSDDLNEEQNKFLNAAFVLIQDLVFIKQKSESQLGQQLKSKTLGKLTGWLGENKLREKVFVSVAFLAICILFFPADYWIVNEASLQSTYKYAVISPQDGYLDSVKVKPGAQVKKDDVLAQLNEDELRLERRKYFSQMQQSQQEYDNALASANRTQAAIANEKVEQAKAQLELIEQQQLRTHLVAPNDGIITSNDISQSVGAPVKQGQILFEVSANQGYIVQLWVDEHDIARVQQQQKGQLKLSSLPNDVFDFTVKSITPISEIRDRKNCFRVEAHLDRESNLLRPGMTGAGKILAGREFYGWILFHDAWYWLRLRLWL